LAHSKVCTFSLHIQTCAHNFFTLSFRLQDVFSSYFSGLTCVSWSPDGRFIATGGQDDLCSIWSFDQKKLISRCLGHSSFVTDIAFDDQFSEDMIKSNLNGNLRFASVSEDCRIIFWDLSNAALRRPKVQQSVYIRRYSANSSLSLTRRRTTESTTYLPLNSSLEDQHQFRFHPPLKRDAVASLQPVMVSTFPELEIQIWTMSGYRRKNKSQTIYYLQFHFTRNLSSPCRDPVRSRYGSDPRRRR
jgi:catabolite repression protein CreC